ncbi:MAG TPA: hypothetical protein VEZ17_03155, partial [Chitinophagaceae bacterium]|nr:hypothetical protein [Chitinophagaceae bacterium]
RKKVDLFSSNILNAHFVPANTDTGVAYSESQFTPRFNFAPAAWQTEFLNSTIVIFAACIMYLLKDWGNLTA